MLNAISSRTAEPSSTQELNPKLTKAAHEFEAMMLSELLKPMQRQEGLFSEDAGDSDSGSADTLKSYAADVMGRALSEKGGFGIAKNILDHFRQKAGKKVSASSLPVANGS